MMVIGIGSSSIATAGDIAAAVCAVEGRAGGVSVAVASLRRGDPDAAIAGACAELGRPLRLFETADLIARAAECQTRSSASLAAHGVPSVAEAAALAGAGPGSRLLVARLVFERVTAAAATSLPVQETS